jgi:hypothetical protein
MNLIRYIGLLLCIFFPDVLYAFHQDVQVVYRMHPRYPGIGRRLREIPRHPVTLYIGQQPCFYSDGVFFQRAQSQFVVISPPVGCVVSALPVGFRSLPQSGHYFAHGVFYRQVDRGFQVVSPPEPVEPPAVLAPPPSPSQERSVVTSPQKPTTELPLTINIPSYKGVIPIVLQRSGSGYVGPQGEYYTTYPTVEQLKLIYGGSL